MKPSIIICYINRIRRICLYPFYIFFFFNLMLTPQMHGQAFDGLSSLDGHKAQVYFSSGTDERTKRMADRMDKVIGFYKNELGFEPTVTLLVLDPEDWPKYTNFPVYGMPHYNNEILIVASEDNPFWQSFIPPVEQLPTELANQIITTYSDENGMLSMQAFFDLLAIHELGHAYHIQYGLSMQRKWMGELFSNIILHTYIAEEEPDLLPALTVFPQMVVAGGKEGLTYTTLGQLEDHYNEIGQNHPQNYGWYQCRLHSAAADIYNSGGTEALKKLWATLKKQKEVLGDAEFAALLSSQVHQSVADVPMKWDE